MRRLFPAFAVLCSTAFLLAGLGGALTAESTPTPVVPADVTVAKDASVGNGDRYWAEVAAKRCPVK